jgi:predicted neuraminidase
MLFRFKHVDGMRRPALPRVTRLLCVLGAAALVLVAEWGLRPVALPPAHALVPVAMVNGKDVDGYTLRSVAQGSIPMPEGALAAHASSLLVMPSDHAAALTVFWFSGERESGPMVQIAASQLSRTTGTWSAPHYVVNRHAMGELLGHGLRRLGNPVAWLDASGRMHLYVVATGWGGWAAARILHVQQSSAAQTLPELAFAPVRTLPLSWLFNTSYLVRNAPMPLVDGGMVLPVHFELGIKVPAALRFDASGAFRGMERMSQLTHLLQPTVLPQTPEQWVALMRDERSGGKIGVVQTQDGGKHWQDLPDLPLDNPDASVVAMALAPRDMLLVHNPAASGRAQLDISHSQDGLHWTLLQTLEQGAPDAEFSYPAMAWVDGSLWVSYTVDRQRLAWQRLAPVPNSAGPAP